MSSPVADAWIAAGVQHAVLLRVLPVVRHDLAGPLSVMRMCTTLLKRHISQGERAAQQGVERVEQLEIQLADLGEQVRRLRHWDRSGAERVAVRTTITEAVALAQPLLSLLGAQVLPLPQTGWPDAPEAHYPLLCMLLASLYYLAERPDVLPGPITLQLAPGGLLVNIGTAAPSEFPRFDVAPSTTPPIDAAALNALARHGGWTLEVSSDNVRIGLPGA